MQQHRIPYRPNRGLRAQGCGHRPRLRGHAAALVQALESKLFGLSSCPERSPSTDSINRHHLFPCATRGETHFGHEGHGLGEGPRFCNSRVVPTPSVIIAHFLPLRLSSWNSKKALTPAKNRKPLVCVLGTRRVFSDRCLATQVGNDPCLRHYAATAERNRYAAYGPCVPAHVNGRAHPLSSDARR